MEYYFAMRDLKLDPKLDTPLGGLSPRWLLATNDGSLEFRIAVALASIGRTGGVGGIRSNLSPIDPVNPRMWATGAGMTAWKGNSLPERMTCALKRRLIDAERFNCDSLPLWASIRVNPQDAAAFLERSDLDEGRIEELLFGLTLIDWHDSKTLDRVKPELFQTWRAKQGLEVVSRAYALLKHLFHPGLEVRPERAILSLLEANRTSDACEIARRRLRAAGKAPLNVEFLDEGDGLRLAASLLIPIYSIEGLSRLVLGEQKDGVAVQSKGR
jgi:CRISPR-associated protein Csx17